MLSNKIKFDAICNLPDFVDNELGKRNKCLEIFLALIKFFDAVEHTNWKKDIKEMSLKLLYFYLTRIESNWADCY